jgi:hypothetical protein
MAAKVGNAIKTDDCYFSADGGTTARSYDNLSAGDTLFWNGIIAGFDLEPSDLISFQYAAL